MPSVRISAQPMEIFFKEANLVRKCQGKVVYLAHLVLGMISSGQRLMHTRTTSVATAKKPMSAFYETMQGEWTTHPSHTETRPNTAFSRGPKPWHAMKEDPHASRPRPWRWRAALRLQLCQLLPSSQAVDMSSRRGTTGNVDVSDCTESERGEHELDKARLPETESPLLVGVVDAPLRLALDPSATPAVSILKLWSRKVRGVTTRVHL